MTRSVLKATTALGMTLSLLQPAPLLAEGFGGPERLWLAQADCAADPTLPECAPSDPAATPPQEAPAAEVPEPADAAPAAEPAPDPVLEPVPEPAAEPPADAAPAPEEVPAAEAPGDQLSEPAAEPAAEAPVETVTEQSPADQSAAEGSAAEQPAVEPPAEETPPTERPAVEPPAEETPPAEQPSAEAPAEPSPAETQPEAAPAEPAAPEAPAAETLTTETPGPAVEPEPIPEPIPEPTPEEAAVIEELMEQPDVAAAVETLEAAAAVTAPEGSAEAATAPLAAVAASEGAAPAPAEVTTQTLTEDQTRTSTQDFLSAVATSAPASAAAQNEKKGLTDLEKAGLVALGAVAVGMLINNSRVVANSGDRVVVDQGNGNLAIWKDDNAILRQPGVTETTQRFSDGSTLTAIERGDGSQIVTIRDATGRVLRREVVLQNGQRVPIIDDTRAPAPIRVSELPPPRVPSLNLSDSTDIALLRALLDEAEIDNLGRFNLAQVRDTERLRALAPELSAQPITFATASSAIRPEEAAKLARLAGLMNDLIRDNPSEVFLIEGHSDAVGSAAYNLALSDRRAESVALALSEIFGVPAENMVVQGYGERFLKVQSAGDEPANRRVAVRRITWLLQD
jgi:outer membrane protein OmpA-like peptidoglycan-associated protein